MQQGKTIPASSWAQQARRRGAAATAGWRRYRPALALAVLFAIALAVAQILLLDRMHPRPYEVPVGAWPDHLFVEGFHEQQGSRPNRYRWSAEGARVNLRQVGTSAGALLSLRLGEKPRELDDPRLTLLFNERPYATFGLDYTPRTYRLLVPRWGMQRGDLVVGLDAPLFSTPTDPRRLGARLDNVSLDFAAGIPVLPAPRQLLEQLLLLALCALTLRRVGWGLPAIAGALAALALGLLIVYGRHLLLLDHYMGRLSVVALLLTTMVWVLPRLLVRRVPWAGPEPFATRLAAITLLACALRLAGALFPIFAAHDLPRNIKRLLIVHGGELVITARSAEFGSGFTVYPPAPYVAFLPVGLLNSDPTIVVQGTLALLDGTSALFVGLLALRLGLTRRAALLAALLYAALPISLTGLWWGFTAQTFGQWLMAPLALLLLEAFRRPRWQLWAASSILLAMALLAHIGVAILAVAWLGIGLVALPLRAALPWRTWRAYAASYFAGCAVGFLFIYLDVAGSMAEQFFQVGSEVAGEPFQSAYNLIWRGFEISYTPLGLALLPLGLSLLFGRLRAATLALAGAWALATLAFWRIAPGFTGMTDHAALLVPLALLATALLAEQFLPDSRGPLSAATVLIGSWVAAAILFFVVELLVGLQVRYIYFLMPLGCIALGLVLDRSAARGVWGTRAAWTLAALLTLQGALLWYGGTFEGLKLSITPLSH
jgi:hypothetical protein